MPQPPAINWFQKVSMSWPMDETTPRPVTTTRRSVKLLGINQKRQLKLIPVQAAPERFNLQLLLLHVFDVFDDIADALQLFSLFVRYLVPKLFFQSHHQFHGIQRIGA